MFAIFTAAGINTPCPALLQRRAAEPSVKRFESLHRSTVGALGRGAGLGPSTTGGHLLTEQRQVAPIQREALRGRERLHGGHLHRR